MASLNDNSKGIKFSFKGSQQAPYQARHEFYDVDTPESFGQEEILAAVIEQGYKTQNKAAWYEPYANVYENSQIVTQGDQMVVRPSYELIITYPNLD